MYPKWWSFIGRCEKSDNRPKEGLAKFGYESHMKYKSLISHLYFCLHIKIQFIEVRWFFLLFFSTFNKTKPSKITSFYHQKNFLAKFSNKERFNWIPLVWFPKSVLSKINVMFIDDIEDDKHISSMCYLLLKGESICLGMH